MLVDAQKPFDASATADAILRSSDSVDFFVIKLLLCSVSPFFNGILTSNHVEADKTRDGLPVVSVTEDSTTLHHLLSLIYPSYVMASEPVLHIDQLCRVAKAAQKYCMDRIEERMKQMVITSQLLQEHAFRVYVSAIHLGWTDVAAKAALNTLKTPLSELPFAEELRIISGADFYHYLTYRFKNEKHGREGNEIKLTFASQNPIVDEQSHIPTTTNVPSLFGPAARADAILRSSDGIDFYVKKSFLSYLSPTFEKLFMDVDGPALGLTGGEAGNHTVFAVEEDSSVLSCLLCFLHPYVGEPAIDDIQLYRKISAAARHYQVTFIARRLEQLFLASSFIQAEPWRCYAIGANLGWVNAMKASATRALEEPLSEMKYADEFRLISGTDLYRMIAHRFLCGRFASLVLDRTLERILVDYPEVSERLPTYIAFLKPRLLESPRGSTLMKNDFELLAAARFDSNGTGDTRGRARFVSSEQIICNLLLIRNTLASMIDEEIPGVFSTTLKIIP